jgi:hypothetical protein
VWLSCAGEIFAFDRPPPSHTRRSRIIYESEQVKMAKSVKLKEKTEKKLHGFIPKTNYTDRAVAA